MVIDSIGKAYIQILESIGLNRNPTQDEIDANKKLGDTWKKTLTMSHSDYMKKVSQELNSKDPSSSAAKVMRNAVDQREADPEADDANREKVKKIKPKTNVYQ